MSTTLSNETSKIFKQNTPDFLPREDVAGPLLSFNLWLPTKQLVCFVSLSHFFFFLMSFLVSYFSAVVCVIKFGNLLLYTYTLAVSPSLRGSRQHKRDFRAVSLRNFIQEEGIPSPLAPYLLVAFYDTQRIRWRYSFVMHDTTGRCVSSRWLLHCVNVQAVKGKYVTHFFLLWIRILILFA